jgi:hypothetical protein
MSATRIAIRLKANELRYLAPELYGVGAMAYRVLVVVDTAALGGTVSVGVEGAPTSLNDPTGALLTNDAGAFEWAPADASQGVGGKRLLITKTGAAVVRVLVLHGDT